MYEICKGIKHWEKQCILIGGLLTIWHMNEIVGIIKHTDFQLISATIEHIIV